MREQVEIQSLLRKVFTEIQIKNPGFSLRAYAKKLEVSPSALSEILNGKRKISGKMAAKIVSRMEVSEEVGCSILRLFDKRTKKLSFEDKLLQSGGHAITN